MKKLKALILAVSLIATTAIHAQAADPGTHCVATTTKGIQCRNMAQKGSKYCYVHDPATPRCGAIKKDGTPCRITVKHLGDHCRFHS